MNLEIDRVLDGVGTGLLGTVLQLFTDWSPWLGIGLIIAAVINSAMTKKVPWTGEASVWLYSMAATACFAAHCAAIPA